MVAILTAFMALAAIGGGVGYFVFPVGLKMGIKQAINLKENGMVYPIYVNPPFKSHSEFHLFAITNPTEVLKGGKMNLVAKGPYVYNTALFKDNVSFSNSGQKVKFESHRSLELDEKQSANLDEKMWLLNPVLPTAHKTIKSLILDRIPFARITEPIVFNTANVLLDSFNERLITKTTPRVLLEGRKVELLESLEGLASRFGLKGLLPKGPPDNIFGLAYTQNKIIEYVEVWTGISPTEDKFAEVSSWKDKQKLDVWKGNCNSIRGTNGELYKPFVEEGESIRIFLGPLCRSIQVDPANDEPVVIETGLRALEYEISPRTYMGSRNNPDNKCYCENTRMFDCQFDGLLRMAPCFFNTPIYFGRANQKGMDPRISDTFQMDPSSRILPDKQSFYLEPLTGTVLKVNLTIQAYVKMLRQSYLRDMGKIQNITYAPLFTISESITVPYSAVWPIHMLQMLNDNHELLMGGMAVGGSGLLLIRYIFMR